MHKKFSQKILVVCCGIPRSGSTLYFNIVKNILDVSKFEYKFHGYVEEYEQRKIYNNYLNNTDKSIEIFKCHFLIKEIIQDENILIFYSTRNLNQIAYSLRKKFNSNNEEIISTIELSLKNLECIEGRINAYIHPYNWITNFEDKLINDITGAFNIAFSNSNKTELKSRIKRINDKNTLFLKLKEILYMINLYLRIMPFLRLFFGENIILFIKKNLYPHDNSTLFHSSHITNAEKTLSSQEKQNLDKIIEKHFYSKEIISRDYLN